MLFRGAALTPLTCSCRAFAIVTGSLYFSRSSFYGEETCLCLSWDPLNDLMR